MNQLKSRSSLFLINNLINNKIITQPLQLQLQLCQLNRYYYKDGNGDKYKKEKKKKPSLMSDLKLGDIEIPFSPSLSSSLLSTPLLQEQSSESQENQPQKQQFNIIQTERFKDKIHKEIDQENKFKDSNQFFEDLGNKMISKINDSPLNSGKVSKDGIINEHDKFAIYKNEKQYHEYRSLTIVRVREPPHRKYTLEQLKLHIPGSNWSLSKDNLYLITGNINPDRYKEFIEKSIDFTSIPSGDVNNVNNNNVLIKDSSLQPFVGFAKQILPNSIEVNGVRSNKAWVDIICEFIIKNCKSNKWPSWRIHLTTPTSSLNSEHNEKSKLEIMVLEKLNKISRAIYNSYSFNALRNRPIPLKDNETLVQIMVTQNNENGYISITTPVMHKYFEKMISIFPSGRSKNIDSSLLPKYMHRLFSPQLSQCHIHIQKIKNHLNPSIPLTIESFKAMGTDDIIADFLPSRSFVKLFELFARYGSLNTFPTMQFGETVVDLGSSPGGWTLYSLLQGCTVISIDKAPLNQTKLDLQHDKQNLIYLEMDAFTFNPGPNPLDWLLCDMKVPAMKTLLLLEQWIHGKHCKNFIVNLKYQPSIDFRINDCETFITNKILPNVKYLNSHCLDCNGELEITLFGTVF